MKENKMAREVAVAELNAWYDLVDVDESRRIDIDDKEGKEESDMMREKVISAFMTGRMTLQDEKLVYTLLDPITKKESGDVVLSELSFKPRYRAFELETQMKGVNHENMMSITRAYIATLTGVSKSILGQLYNKDMSIAQAVYTLFSRGEY